MVEYRADPSDLVEPEAASNPGPRPDTLGWVLLALPAVSTLLIWTWIGGMNPLEEAASSLSMLVALTIIGMAILCAVDARRLGMGSTTDRAPKGKRKGAALWFFQILMLWVVFIPMYLHRRRLYGVPGRLVLGLLVMLAFIGSWLLMTTALGILAGAADIQRTLASLGGSP